MLNIQQKKDVANLRVDGLYVSQIAEKLDCSMKDVADVLTELNARHFLDLAQHEQKDLTDLVKKGYSSKQISDLYQIDEQEIIELIEKISEEI